MAEIVLSAIELGDVQHHVYPGNLRPIFVRPCVLLKAL